MARTTPLPGTSGNDRAVEEAAERRRPVGTGVADGVRPGPASRTRPDRAAIEPPGAFAPDPASVRAAIEFMKAFRKTHDLGGESIVHWIREGRR